MREADKVVSMKEDIDAMSWSRVGEIAKLLQVDHTEEQRLEWARELLSIARTNSWVLDKFGVSAENMTGRVIPSGIEVQQGDRYLSETTAADMPSAEDVPGTMDAPVEAETSAAASASEDAGATVGATAALAADGLAFETDCGSETGFQLQPEPQAGLQSQSKPEPQPASPAPESDGSFIETKGVLRKKRRAEKRSHREKLEAKSFSIPTAAPPESAALDFEQIATPGFGQDTTSLEELRSRSTVTRASVSFGEIGSGEASSDASRDVDSAEHASGLVPQDIARFKHLCSNKKGSLCLYEDSEGHLVAVDPSRFA